LKSLLILSFLLLSTSRAQQSNTTSGQCSPIAPNNSGSVTINCSGLTAAQRQLLANIPALLTKLLASQTDNTSEILSKLDTCIAQGADRRLTESQRASILAKISLVPGHRIKISIPLGNAEAKSYGMEFVALFRQARWIGVEGTGLNQSVWDKDPVGIQINVNEADAKAGRLPNDAVMLMDTFVQLGLIDQRAMFIDAGTPSGDFGIAIGVKPATVH